MQTCFRLCLEFCILKVVLVYAKIINQVVRYGMGFVLASLKYVWYGSRKCYALFEHQSISGANSACLMLLQLYCLLLAQLILLLCSNHHASISKRWVSIWFSCHHLPTEDHGPCAPPNHFTSQVRAIQRSSGTFSRA